MEYISAQNEGCRFSPTSLTLKAHSKGILRRTWKIVNQFILLLSLMLSHLPFVPSAAQPQWCDVCCTEYSSSLSSHLSSTLHQFALRRPPPTPYYCLPPSSNSYKMMVRCGWRPGTGLGPEGEGCKQPVSTVLKRDQKGLGYGQMETAKVTHFQARDHDAVKPPSKKKEERGGKAQRKKERIKEQNDKNWERDFRSSFYLWHLLIVIFLEVLSPKHMYKYH